MQQLVDTLESLYSTEMVFINNPRVFLPRGALQYQTLSGSLKLSKAFGLCHSKSRDGSSLDKYSSNALTGHNAGFSVFSYILPSSEESNGSSFCLWFLRSPVLVDVFSPCSVNTDWKRLSLVKTTVLSPSTNKVKHNAETNEVLQGLGSGDNGSYDK